VAMATSPRIRKTAIIFLLAMSGLLQFAGCAR
jgi:hypothetical protein